MAAWLNPTTEAGMHILNETHDPTLRSWVSSANEADTDFPIQNLPFGVFKRRDSTESFRGGVAIGSEILDLNAAIQAGVFEPQQLIWAQAAAGPELNPFMAMGSQAWSGLRLTLSRLLREGAASQKALQSCLVPQAQAQYALPARVGDYTDFYTSVHHATSVGKMFRPDQPLLPNYKWVPIGYHGRASSLIVSGTDVRRPQGQTKTQAEVPVFGPTQRLDYELELGYLIGPGNPLGQPIDIAQAHQHVFGVVLFNDWSARDIQPWEYQPLGPFLSKNFASTLSPWVVTQEALWPFGGALARTSVDPEPLPYLRHEQDLAQGALDIELEVWLQSARMQQQGMPAMRLSHANSREAAYWTPAQLVAHHTCGGCNLQPGDLLGSGTLSGPQPEQAGSMLELAQAGKQPLTLPSGETRTFLADGDVLSFKAWCQRSGARRIGFGVCEGRVTPAQSQPLQSL
jgi:fumarylacetoacetase